MTEDKEPKEQEGQKQEAGEMVVVVQYHHNHGTEVWVRRTEQQVKESLLWLVREKLGEFPEMHIGELKQALEDDDFDKVMTLWDHLMAEDFMTTLVYLPPA